MLRATWIYREATLREKNMTITLSLSFFFFLNLYAMQFYYAFIFYIALKMYVYVYLRFIILHILVYYLSYHYFSAEITGVYYCVSKNTK